ncbi:helix-turn-helix transcriptional regulator [Longispora sp. K20-0274]|uniref:helix-turn-helix domain-containing protein n=1 Tax=Longispora sp. K20-0274 TaxID=3088255 RepID=UPI00399B30AF
MAQRQADLDPTASAAHLLGAEVRLHRDRRGLSPTQLATLLFVGPHLIYKIEKAQRFPALELIEQCDELFGTEGALVRLWRLAARERADATRPEVPQNQVVVVVTEPGSLPGLLADLGPRAGRGATRPALAGEPGSRRGARTRESG